MKITPLVTLLWMACLHSNSDAAIFFTDLSTSPIIINNTPTTQSITINGSVFQFVESWTTNGNDEGMMQIQAITSGAAVASSGTLEDLGQYPSTIPLDMLVAANIETGFSIGSEKTYSSEIQLLNHNEYFHYGNFIVRENQQGKKAGYIGISMQDPTDGLIRYGWISYEGYEYRTQEPGNPWIYKSAGTISGFAYNSTANEAIVAGAIPEPSTCGLLAVLGAGGLVLRRRARVAA